MEKIWLQHYPQGVPVDIKLDPAKHGSTIHLLEEAVRRFAPMPAFLLMGKTLTFQSLYDKSRQMAVFFQQQGLKKGDRIALSMPNVLQYPIALFGAHMAGLTVVPCNPLYTARELSHQLKDSGARMIVIFETFAHTLQSILANTPIEKVVIASVGDELGIKGILANLVVRHVKKMVPTWSIPGAIAFKDAMAQGAQGNYRETINDLEDIAFLQYTGGTTGVSKGAMLTHRNIVSNVLQAQAWIGNILVPGKDMIVTALPMYHIFALTANCLTMMTLGVANLLIINARDINAMVDTMKKEPWTVITAVNTLFNALLHHEGFRQLNFKDLKFCLGGGMAVQKTVAEEWFKVTGCHVSQAYGLSETSPAVTMNRFDEAYNGAIGYPISSTEVTIRDGSGAILPQGEVGEICVKGPQVMLGYWQNPSETERVFWGDHVFRTGDMGKMDELGLIYIVDRLKDIVLVSGFNVYPNEVEEILMMHPTVKECGVIGVSDERTGEALCAFVVRKPTEASKEWTEAEFKQSLIAHCHENLTNYKVPKQFHFINELPKTNVGKVLRRELKTLIKTTPS